MSASKPLPRTDRSLPIALLRARERVMGPIRQMLADADITEQQWRVLRILEESGPLDPTRIAEKACLLLPSLTRILQKLDEKGLVRREQDTGDKRRQVISIAPAGADVIERNLDTSIELIERLRAAMGPSDYEKLLDLLNQLDRVRLDD